MPSAGTPSRWVSARCPHVRLPPTRPVEGGARPVAAEPTESSQVRRDVGCITAGQPLRLTVPGVRTR